MTVQWSDTVRNNLLDAWESSIGTSPSVELRTGAQPASTATAAAGTLLVSIPLPVDWASAAASGTKSLTGLPLGAAAGAAGAAGHYRIVNGATCHEQGSVTAVGGGGDMTVDNISIASGQIVQITSWSKTAPGA